MLEENKTIEELKSELEQSRIMCDRLRENNRREVAQIYDSLSWRITAPLRYFGGFFMNGGGDSIGYYPLKSRKNLIRKYGKASFPDMHIMANQRKQAEGMQYKPVFSILVPLYNTPKRFLKEMIESVIGQTYPYWELCFADASDSEHGYVKDTVERYISRVPDSRSKILYKKLDDNLGISGNTNVCLRLATGDYIGLFDHDDLLHPELLFEYAKRINKDNADFLYCDELTFKGGNVDQIVTLHLKPDFSKYTLLSNNYICHFTAFRRNLLEEGEGFNSEYDGSQDYDMILRMTSRAKCIAHVGRVLYYWRSHSGSTAGGIGAKNYAIGAGRKVLENYISKEFKRPFYVSSVFVRDTIYRTRYSINGNPGVCVVVDNTTAKEIVKKETLYSKCDVVMAEDFEALLADNKVSEFQYIAFVRGEVRELSKDWIEQLLMFAQMDDVGVVGGLAHDNGKIIDAGFAYLNAEQGGTEQLYYGRGIDELGYMARLTYVHELSGFAGTFCMCKTNLLLEAAKKNGHNMSVTELCYKTLTEGLHNLFSPFALLNTGNNNTLGTNVLSNIEDKFYTCGLMDRDIFEVQ